MSRTSAPRSGHWAAAAIGVIAGLASGLLGVGGGFMIVPLQVMWTKTAPHRASGTSLAAILPIALVGAAVYYFGHTPHQVDLMVAMFLVGGSVVGAYLGARAIDRVPERALRMLVAALLVVVGLDQILGALLGGQLLAGHQSTPAQLTGWHYPLIVGAGLLIGALSGVTGVGGGIFLVPTMVIGFGLSQHLAQGTSLVAILPTAAVGAVTHLRRGNVEVRTAIWIGLAGIPAALIGAALALALPQSILAGVFGAFLLFAASRIWLFGGRASLNVGTDPVEQPSNSTGSASH